MLSKITNKLSDLSGGLIDWSNSANLLRSGIHHYTNEQSIVRGAMALTIAAFGLLAVHHNDPNKSNHSNLVMGIAGATFGLVVSHIYVVAPLFYKRYKASKECGQLLQSIRAKAKEAGISDDTINAKIGKITGLSLADKSGSHVSQTWGRKLALLSELDASLAKDIAANKDAQSPALRM